VGLLPAAPWSPSGDERSARAAAGQWRALATATECAVDELRRAAALVTEGSEGRAIDAFTRYWEELAGPGQQHLHDVVATCRAIGDCLDAYADALADARLELAEQAASVAASVAVGATLAWFTGGATVAVAGGAMAAASVEAAAVSATLVSRAAAIARLVGLHATVGAVEGVATHAVVEPALALAFRPNTNPLAGYSREGFALAAATGAVLPGWRGLRSAAGAGALDDLAVAGRPLGAWAVRSGRGQHLRDLAVDVGYEAAVTAWEHQRPGTGDAPDPAAGGLTPGAGP
jgi:hypothetical protein